MKLHPVVVMSSPSSRCPQALFLAVQRGYHKTINTHVHVHVYTMSLSFKVYFGGGGGGGRGGLPPLRICLLPINFVCSNTGITCIM